MTRTQKNVTVFSVALIATFIAMYLMFATVTNSTGGLLVASFMTGLTLVLGAITMMIQRQRHQAAFDSKQKAGANLSAEQSRTVEIDLPLEAAFDLALAALNSLDGEAIPKTLTGIPSKQHVKVHKADRAIGRIEAGLRAKTMGIQDFVDFSQVNIQLQRLDANTTRVQLDSRPANSLEVYDMARHTHYVNQLAVYLRKESQHHAASVNLAESQADDDILDDSEQSARLMQG